MVVRHYGLEKRTKKKKKKKNPPNADWRKLIGLNCKTLKKKKKMEGRGAAGRRRRHAIASAETPTDCCDVSSVGGTTSINRYIITGLTLLISWPLLLKHAAMANTFSHSTSINSNLSI